MSPIVARGFGRINATWGMWELMNIRQMGGIVPTTTTTTEPTVVVGGDNFGKAAGVQPSRTIPPFIYGILHGGRRWREGKLSTIGSVACHDLIYSRDGAIVHCTNIITTQPTHGRLCKPRP